MTEIGARLAAVERLQYWALGLIGGLILALLTGAFAVIAALQLHQKYRRGAACSVQARGTPPYFRPYRTPHLLVAVPTVGHPSALAGDPTL